jgi:hypothetical protein
MMAPRCVEDAFVVDACVPSDAHAAIPRYSIFPPIIAAAPLHPNPHRASAWAVVL